MYHSLLSFVCPFIYSIIIGIVWSLLFKRKFSVSLAPAYMTHILIILLSGLIFKRLSIGIWGGCVVTAAILAFYMLKCWKTQGASLSEVRKAINHFWHEGGNAFTCFYIFCFFINYNKRFITWDEFSHWGIFLKECIRLDSLYCMSPLWFAHKDYVPAMTLFETLWCKLSFRYAEPDVYRGIQVFMFSMMMPMFERFNFKKLLQLGSVIIALMVPLLFKTNDAFCFYHSIYCDVAVGIVFYWCMFEAYKEYEDLLYAFLALTIGISVLVISKMIAMALAPLVIGYFVVRSLIISGKKINWKKSFLILPVIVVPVALWTWFNAFVTKYIGKMRGIQSYGGMKISSIKEVFWESESSSIPYLKQVRDSFVDAIIHRDILIHGSYTFVIAFIAVAFFAMSIFVKNKNRKRTTALLGMWVLVSGIYYALLIYFLYATAFSEYEATRLASYERYMNSFVIAVLLLLIAVFYNSEIWKNHSKVIYYMLLSLTLLLVFQKGVFDQVMPGNVTRDEEKLKAYTDGAQLIMNTTDENDSIYVVKRGDNGDFLWHQRYYCNPRTIGGGSIGPKVNEGDIWSNDIEVDEFVKSLKAYDYIYFRDLDEAFLEKYSAIFDNPSQLVNGQIYKIKDIDQKVKLCQE